MGILVKQMCVNFQMMVCKLYIRSIYLRMSALIIMLVYIYSNDGSQIQISTLGCTKDVQRMRDY